ncbi:MAG: histidinol-phosphate aminotransferase, partial [Chlorobiaceae bacterium]|nr:histidinol-phosphate aminotransferase [Chlorobiaceae bacterium]
HELFNELSRRDILVRDVSGYHLMENCLRFNIGLRDENDALLQQLRLLCDERV